MVEVTLNTHMLNVIEKRLKGLEGNGKSILKKAVNDTAKDARVELSKVAKSEYSVKASRFNRAMQLKRGTVSKPVAVIRATGESLELKEFKVTPNQYTTGANRPDILKGKVYRKGSYKKLEKGNVKAFIARFKSGHVAVVQRVPEKRMKSKPNKEFLKKLLSPSVPTMLGNENKVFGIVEPGIEANLMKYINLHIDKLLEV